MRRRKEGVGISPNSCLRLGRRQLCSLMYNIAQ